MAKPSLISSRLQLGRTESAQPSYDLNAFEMWQPQPPQPSRGFGFASITAAFQSRQQQQQQQQDEQRPRPVGLFALAEAPKSGAGMVAAPKDGTGKVAAGRDGRELGAAQKRADRKAAKERRDNPLVPELDWKIVKIKGDGRCMFRALASGMSWNQGHYIVGSEEEEKDADALRMATHDALCRNPQRKAQFPDAVQVVNQENVELQSSFPKYCAKLKKETFWGGNVELLVLSKMLQVPIVVYTDLSERKQSEKGFVPIAKFGEQYLTKRDPVTVLYRKGNHYDLLMK